MMDVHFLVCPVRPGDHPTSVSITTRPCGYSHNALPITPLGTQHNVIVPPRLLGICVRPVTKEMLSDPDFVIKLSMWLEYLRYIGVDQVFLYLPKLNDSIRKVIDMYSSETFRILSWSDWDVLNKNLDLVTSSEAATMDCIYKNMMGYKYILVLDYVDYPIFHRKTDNLKQLVRSDWFAEKVKEYGGFRIESGVGNKAGFVVESRLVLATAARYFIALTRRPYYQSLDLEDLRIGTIEDMDLNLKKHLEKHTSKKLKIVSKI